MENIKGNFKQIREIYGATQEEIAKAIGVTRATISQWETGAAKASSANLEKLSIFYGIGPESFYELKGVDSVRKQLLVDNSEKARRLQEETQGARNKADDFHRLFENVTFLNARQQYMFSMKMMLACADEGKLEDLKAACEINRKMGDRLKAIIDLREAEETDEGETLYSLLGNLADSPKDP